MIILFGILIELYKRIKHIGASIGYNISLKDDHHFL